MGLKLIDKAWEIVKEDKPQICKLEIIENSCPAEYGLESYDNSRCDLFTTCQECWNREDRQDF